MSLAKNKIIPLPILALCIGLSCFASIGRAIGSDFSSATNIELGNAIYIDMQGDPLQAMSLVMAANDKRQLGSDVFLARLFLADKLAEQGLYKYALTLYQSVGNKAEKGSDRDQAWLNYAQISFELGLYNTAQRSLTQISRTRDAAQTANYKIIQAHTLLAKGQINEAIAALPEISNDSLWALYQRYNFGIKLLGNLGNKHGAVILHELANLETDNNSEILALKDQANLAIGFSLLKLNNPAKARSYLEQVRLNGPMTNVALLGMGWSYSAEDNQEKALVFWLELQERPLANAYIYESLLAVPYALGKAGAHSQAIDYYDSAQLRFESEIQSVDASIKAINQGKLFTLLNMAPEKETGWVENWQASASEAQFLSLLIDNSSFQAALKEYRALLKFTTHTSEISHEIESFNNHPDAKSISTDAVKLQAKLSDIRKKLDATIQARQVKLRDIALNTLERYKKQLTNYVLQAKLGKAQVLEQASLLKRIQQ